MTIYRACLQIVGTAPKAAVNVYAWASTPGAGLTLAALQMPGKPVGLTATYGLPLPAAGTGPAADIRTCARLYFATAGRSETAIEVVVPSYPSWFVAGENETVNPADPAVAAVVAALLAGGLCDTNGHAATGLTKGERVQVYPPPWPNL